MESLARCLALLVVLGMAGAWTNGMNRKQAYNKPRSFPFPWAPARRSTYTPCAYTGQACMTTNQCCNDYDVCLTSLNYNALSGDKGRTSKCQNLKKEMKYAKYSSHLKPSGQICADSSECADFCCREIRGHRARYHVCGTPEDDLMSFTCIQATRTGNDVLDDLI